MLRNIILVLFSLVLCEAALRLAGFDADLEGRTASEIWFAPDPVLGWRNAPGSQEWVSEAEPGKTFTQTIWPGGARASRARQEHQGVRVVLLGGSLMFGWGLDDSETLAWKLQERFPELDIANWGTGAYGSYQSLLLLQRLMKSPETRPAIVVFGLNVHHEVRDIGDPQWRSFLAKASISGNASVPFCKYSSGSGCEHVPPTSYYSDLPLLSNLVMFRVFEELFARIKFIPRRSTGEQATQFILSQMNEVSKRAGARFYTAVLYGDDRDVARYRTALSSQNIPLVDCLHEPYMSGQVKLPDNHPTESTNEYWADCVSNKIILTLDAVKSR